MDQYSEKDYVKVAIMYYDEGMTQAEIARKLGVSRSLISKILIDAKDAKIVEVFINSQSVYTVKLERALELKFGLKDAIVVDTESLSDPEIRRKVGRTAANYLESYIKKTDTVNKIGISWGASLKSVVDYFPYLNYPDIYIYPLVGGMGNEYFYLHSNQLVHELAQKIRAKAHYLYVPAMVSTSALKKELEQDLTISSVLEEAKNVDVALVGIAGINNQNTMSKTGYINANDIAELKELGVIGDINSHFFDRYGDEIGYDINQRVMGLDLNQIKNIPTVVAVAYGHDKVEVIKVSLENQLIDILVTTDTTAQKILNGN
ncbi:sugar-binding transcriptional regulator [Streptococcus caviae]|uniref:sugar-binding transcriptional regulator n=1 Tax=Streptococcus sp. 'caviae' TaxID=1915004 RepID=UPI00094B88A9|nr:sugar-binding transcriptional regulator [Streptococcus sp. 'caviae']OLN84722.1 transcriptional regulator [Streptococcus sp. 'caviae']